MFSTGCLTRKHKWIRPSTEEPERHKQPHIWRPWSPWGPSTSPVSAEGTTTQQRFLECIRNFLIQGKTKRSDLLDIIHTNKEGLVGDGKVKASLGCSDHEMVEFRGPSQHQAFCDSVMVEDTASL